MSATPAQEEVLAALADLRDPDTANPLSAEGQLRDFQFSPGKIELTLALATHAAPLAKSLAADVEERIKNRFPGLEEVVVHPAIHPRSTPQVGSLPLRAKSVIAVGSGKGGVGKSTIAAILAFGMQRLGCKVGLMDADVYGPSVPHLLGIRERPEVFERPGANGQMERRIAPVMCGNMPVMSMGFLVDPEQAIVWRGPMLHGAIKQFLADTEWGELDYLFIDLPPGTGDIALSLTQLLPLSGAVIVCTPQDVALIDAVRAISMFRQVKTPVLGVVENMSYFLCPDNGKRYEIFGSGGAKQKAAEYNVPFLGEVPINIQIRVRGDEGKISGVFEEAESEAYLDALCYNLARSIAEQTKHRPAPAIPSLNILGQGKR